MARLRRLRAFELVRILERYGFEYSHHSGSHIILERQLDGLVAVVPDKRNRPVAPGTINSIVRQSGIPRSEFE